jgi:hypothetical protein
VTLGGRIYGEPRVSAHQQSCTAWQNVLYQSG